MIETELNTKEKIIFSALELFSENGIQKTSMDDVAYHAGVTRVTVYRYFADKRDLVREVFLHVEKIFQKGLAELEQNPQAGWGSVMDQIGEELSALPSGDVFARADELKRLYPEIGRAIQKVRETTLNSLFEGFFDMAERQGLLRPDLNRPVVQAIFAELTINFFDNPRFKSLGLSDAELYKTIKNLLLYGILRSKPSTARSRR